MKRMVLWILPLLLSGAPALAQDAGHDTLPTVALVSLFSGSEFPVLLNDAVPTSYDSLVASVAVEDKAAQISWAPFLVRPWYNWLAETRLQVGQKDNKTNLGLVLRWNPLSPRGKLGGIAWIRAVSSFKPFDDRYARLQKSREVILVQRDLILAEKDPRILVLKTSGSDLTRQLQVIDGCHFDLKSTQENCKKLEEGRQAVADSLRDVTKELAIARDAATISHRDGLFREIQALEDSLDWAGDPAGRQTIHAQIDRKLAELTLGGNALTAIEADLAAIEKAKAKEGMTTVAAFETELFSKPYPAVSLSYSASLFPFLKSSFVDADSDGLNDNAHKLAGRSFVLSAASRFGQKDQLSAALGRTWKRAIAEAGSGLAESNNYSLTYGHILKVLDPEYRTSDDYLSSLFIPSVVGGLSIEVSNCRSKLSDCQDKASRIVVATPFVDVKIKKAAQFRLGVTWKRASGLATSDEQLGVLSLISLQLSAPSN